jgi:hypothetical protein
MTAEEGIVGLEGKNARLRAENVALGARLTELEGV